MARARRRAVHGMHFEREPAFCVHGVACVNGEVDQRGFKLADVRPGETVALTAGLKIDAHLCAHQRTKQLDHALHLQAHIKHFRAERLLAGESQQLTGEFDGTPDGVKDQIEIPAVPLDGKFVAAQQLDRGADDRQQVVDMWRAKGLTVFQVAPGDF